MHLGINRHSLLLTGLAVLISATVGVPQRAMSSDQYPGKDWQQWSSPQDAGFSPDIITELNAESRKCGAACVLVIFDGAVLFHFGDVRTRFMCHSVRKSFMSALFGIYVDRGIIDSDTTIGELGIDDRPSALTQAEKTATIRDLLSSRSGVYHESAYEPTQMSETRPSRESHAVGSHWWYNNWDFNTLLTIFEKQSGEKFFTAFRDTIAQPIGLQDFRLRDGYYHYETERSVHAAYPFQMSTRDMARIGLLMASDGRWRDRQILSSAWVTNSTRPHSKINNWQGFDGYGFMWWTAGSGADRVFSAQGTGGHSIYVFPDRKLVFVFRANTYRGESVGFRSRLRMIDLVTDGHTSTPIANPKLVPIPLRGRTVAPATLGAEYLQQFPLELRRELPRDLPPDVRDEPVRLELIDGTLVLFTRRPPALAFDLIPVASDRFLVSETDAPCAIDRDANGMPRRFLLKNDLLRHIMRLERVGDSHAANTERRILAKLFPGVEETGK